MAVLLIGSTGNGKSTLGNFFVNPEKEHIFGEQQTFKTARTNKPETQTVQSATVSVELAKLGNSDLSVIDTPGIFEDEDKDIEHMINIIRALHMVGEIRACILVVKFSSKIDTPYKASIKYYSKLLPGLFETNLIIVMTDYACDERSRNLRAMQGIDEDQIKANILREIIEVCGVSHQPKLFTIDCLPMSESEFSTNRQTREDVVHYVFTFQSVSTKDLKVAKTDSIMAEDRIAVATLEGEVTAYEERLEQSYMDAHSAHTNVERHAKRIDTLKVEVSDIRVELGTMDTEDLIESKEWITNVKWRLFKRISHSYKLESDWPIQDISYWTNGKCRWTSREVVSQFCIQGTARSKCSRGLYAKVSVKVYKRDKYGEDIEALRNDIASKEELLSSAKQEHDTSKQKHREISAEIESLVRNIETKNAEIRRLSSEYLTMEECLERFQLQ